MSRERFRKLKPHVSERTIITYATNIKRLRKIDKNLEYGPISQYLKTMKPSSAANLLTAVIVLEGRDRFGKLYKTLNQDAESVRYDQKFTSHEYNNWITVRQYQEGIRRAKFDIDRLNALKPMKHKRTTITTLIQYLLLMMYQELHWRSDAVSIKVGKHVGDNYYHDGKFYLNKFKTARKFKQRGLLPVVYTPSRKLGKLIKQYLAVREAQGVDHDYFLITRGLKPIKRSAFFEIMTRATFRYVGKKLSSTMLRHIFATHFLASNPSLKDKKKFLHGMMQLNLETFESYARRINGKLAANPV